MLLAESAVSLPGDALRLLSFLACDWQYARAARDAATWWDHDAIRDGRRTPRKRWPEAERLLATLAEHGHLADWRPEGGQDAARQYHTARRSGGSTFDDATRQCVKDAAQIDVTPCRQSASRAD